VISLAAARLSPVIIKWRSFPIPFSPATSNIAFDRRWRCHA
jgi:hypothetical protein